MVLCPTAAWESRTRPGSYTGAEHRKHDAPLFFALDGTAVGRLIQCLYRESSRGVETNLSGEIVYSLKETSTPLAI